MSAPYPWLTRQWGRLCASHRDDRLGHAYLLCGREGLGKFELAHAFAQLVLCESDAVTEHACGGCRSCLLYHGGNHPDLRLLETEDDHKTIVIEQIRELIDFFALKPHYRQRKIAIVHPAEAINRNAVNALLKILEEPPASALLLLVSHRPGVLPATLASRCQRLNIPVPPWPEREAWLAQRGAEGEKLPKLDDLTLQGAPLAILRQLQSTGATLLNEVITGLCSAWQADHDPLATARRFAAYEAGGFIDALEAVLQGMLQMQSGHPPSHLRLPARHAGELQELAGKLHCKRLFLYLDTVALARETVLRSTGVRGNEIIENLWFAWVRTLRTGSTV